MTTPRYCWKDGRDLRKAERCATCDCQPCTGNLGEESLDTTITKEEIDRLKEEQIQTVLNNLREVPTTFLPLVETMAGKGDPLAAEALRRYRAESPTEQP